MPPNTTPSKGVSNPPIEATTEGNLTTILESLQGISANQTTDQTAVQPTKQIIRPSITVELPPIAPTEREKYSIVDKGIEPPLDPMDIDLTAVNIVVQGIVYTTIAALEEPRRLTLVLKTPNQENWLVATRAELKQLLQLGALQFIKALGLNKRAISNRWVLKCKLDALGQIAKFKARLVVKGFK